jgi:hypothetical protein
MRSLLATAAALVTCAVLALAPPPGTQGDFVNWETPPVHPADMTPDGTSARS